MKDSTLKGVFGISTFFFIIIGTALLYESFIIAWGMISFENLRIPAIICYIGAIVSYVSYKKVGKNESLRKKENHAN